MAGRGEFQDYAEYSGSGYEQGQRTAPFPGSQISTASTLDSGSLARRAEMARQRNFLSKIDYVDPNYSVKQAGIVMGGMTLGFAFSTIPVAGVAIGPAVCGAVVGGGLHKLEQDAKKSVGDFTCLDGLLYTAEGLDLPEMPRTYGEESNANEETERRVGFVPSWELAKQQQQQPAQPEEDDDDPFSELISTRHTTTTAATTETPAPAPAPATQSLIADMDFFSDFPSVSAAPVPAPAPVSFPVPTAPVSTTTPAPSLHRPTTAQPRRRAVGGYSPASHSVPSPQTPAVPQVSLLDL